MSTTTHVPDLPASRLRPGVALGHAVATVVSSQPVNPPSISDMHCHMGLERLYPVTGEPNAKDAIVYLMQAANEKHPIALVHLAKIFEKGQHMPQDLSAAADYYKQAADLGDIPAAYAYGVICRDGVGVPIDAKVAQEYLDLASAAGYTHPKPASRDDVPIWGPAPRPKSLGSATYS